MNEILLAHAGGVYGIAVLFGPLLIVLVVLLVRAALRRGAGKDDTSEERAHEAGGDPET